MKGIKVFAWGAVLGILVVAGFGCAQQAPISPSGQPASPVVSPAPTPHKLVMGAGSTTSSAFAAVVAYAEAINKYARDINVDMISIAGTEAKIEALRRGQIDIAHQSSYESQAWAHNGIVEFKDKPPFTKLRTFHITNKNVTYYVVRVDSGITKVEELHGKGFAAGAAGTSTETLSMAFLKGLGIEPKYFTGSWSDAVTAVKDRRIVGYSKAGGGYQVDSTVVDIQSFTPVRILPLSKEQLDKGFKDMPGVVRYEVPSGTILAAPDMGTFWSWGFATGVFITSDVPESVGYQMIKAIVEHWNDIIVTYPVAKGEDPVKLTIDSIKNSGIPVPLHAGVVKYFKEIGVQLPPETIPPEYK